MRYALPTLLICLSLLSTVACDDKKADEKAGDKAAADDPKALASPTLCEHAEKLGYGNLRDETGCIMRLDGLQIQLGPDDWKTHGKCIAGADSTAAVEACVTAADEASLAKANAKAGG